MADKDRQSPDVTTLRTTAAHPNGLPWEHLARPWRLAQELPVAVLDGVDGCPRLAVQLLHNRGIQSAERVRMFLAGEWRQSESALPDLAQAVARLHLARERGEHVVVWGDYDCDGMTSCALLLEALTSLGLQAEPYVALREDDGRGLNPDGVRQLAARGATLIVTTDCGTTNVEEVRLAGALGMDVIVTDHHPPHGPRAPARAMVNPQCAAGAGEEGAPDTAMSGAVVAFRLAEALLLADARPDAQTAIEALLDLVAIGTIADVVPLSPTNWALIRAGLRNLNASPRAGLRALIHGAGLVASVVSARDVAFALAPRLNACGRLGNPMLAVHLLTAHEAAEARRLAAEIEVLHQERQRLTEEMYTQARASALEAVRLHGGEAPPMLLAVGDGWPLGILGLVASRLADEFQRPAFVISRDEQECRGSGRGPRGLDLGLLLARRATLFKRFGGHAQAAGFTLPTADLPDLLAYLNEQTGSATASDAEMTAEGEVQEPQSDGALEVDCRLSLRRLVPENYDAIRSLEPYGTGFPEPIFLCPRVRIVSCWRSGPEGRTLRLRLREDTPSRRPVERVAMWPRRGNLCDAIVQALPSLPPVAMVYTLTGLHGSPQDDIPRILTLSPAEDALVL